MIAPGTVEYHESEYIACNISSYSATSADRKYKRKLERAHTIYELAYNTGFSEEFLSKNDGYYPSPYTIANKLGISTEERIRSALPAINEIAIGLSMQSRESQPELLVSCVLAAFLNHVRPKLIISDDAATRCINCYLLPPSDAKILENFPALKQKPAVTQSACVAAAAIALASIPYATSALGLPFRFINVLHYFTAAILIIPITEELEISIDRSSWNTACRTITAISRNMS